MDRSSENSMRNIEKIVGSHFTGAMREPLGERQVECGKHGFYQSAGSRYMGRREIWTPCPACHEECLAAERQAEAQKLAARARRELESQLGQAAIPQRFVGRTLESFNATTPEQQAALQLTQEFVDQFEAHARRGSGLIFSGPPGTGKSHLATAILQALMPQYCGLYTTCMTVIRTVRGTWRKDSELSEQQVLNLYADTPLLVLDEVGVQYGTDGEQTILFDVLDRRYRDMKPSIFLTNQDKKGFREFIGERTFDRLTETARWIPFDWASYRPRARKESA